MKHLLAFLWLCALTQPALNRCAAATLLFEDTFTNSALNLKYWNPYICSAVGDSWPWNLVAGQPRPSSSEDTPNGNALDYDLPSSISTGNGLQLNLQSGSTAAGYSWTGSILCSCPATNIFNTNSGVTFNHGYVEVRAKMPYTGNGCWPAIWFMPSPANSGSEIDLHEGGELWGATDPDQIVACNFHAASNNSIHFLSGTSLSANYHVYGMEFRPPQAINMFFDGLPIATFTNNVTNTSYYIIINDSLASSKTAGWHTQTNAVTASANPMQVAYVRVYDARPQPAFGNPTFTSGGLVLSGTSGSPTTSYRILAATNVNLPLTNWTAVATNAFDVNGHFSFTNPLTPTSRSQFFRISAP